MLNYFTLWVFILSIKYVLYFYCFVIHAKKSVVYRVLDWDGKVVLCLQFSSLIIAEADDIWLYDNTNPKWIKTH